MPRRLEGKENTRQAERKPFPEVKPFINVGAETYATEFTLSIGYEVAEKAIVEKIAPYLKELQKRGIHPNILEIGAGTGQSTKRIEDLLRKKGITKYNLTTTEPSAKMIAEGKRLNKEAALKHEKDEPARVPDYEAYAEELPDDIKDSSVELIIASHVLHWIDDLPKAFSESMRVLKPGGMLVHATGGIVKDPYFEEVHFTKNPAYKLYLEEVKQILIEKKYWDESWGEFVPTNKKANSFFNQYTSKDIEKNFKEEGFTDMTKTFHKAPLNKKEMLLRMSPAALTIFVIGGKYADEISKEEKEIAEIANTARERALEKASQQELLTGVNVFDNLTYSSQEPEDSTMLYTFKKPLIDMTWPIKAKL